MTNYRDSTCDLRDNGVPSTGAGWLNGSQPRLDRVRFDPNYPG